MIPLTKAHSNPRGGYHVLFSLNFHNSLLTISLTPCLVQQPTTYKATDHHILRDFSQGVPQLGLT